jgi:hypothetical protein
LLPESDFLLPGRAWKSLLASTENRQKSEPEKDGPVGPQTKIVPARMKSKFNLLFVIQTTNDKNTSKSRCFKHL